MGWDCTAKRAAENAYAQACSAYDFAKTQYDNAKQLNDDLNTEQNNVKSMIANYDNIYNSMNSAGGTFCTDSNCGILIRGCSCLENYSNTVKVAQVQSRSELSRCTTNLENARVKRENARVVMNNTHCVWVDDRRR